jgi:hypothetical protein
VTDDERITRLQRLAYGADVPEADRAQAAAELTALAARGAALDREDAAGAADDAPHGPSKTADAAPDGSTPSSPPGPGARAGRETSSDRTSASARLIRWTIAVGAIALLAGIALGLGIGRQVPAAPAASTAELSATPSPRLFGSGEPGTAVADSDLLPLFDRLPPVADPSRVEQTVQGIDPASVRLLATRTDGPAAYLARTLDGADVCLVVLLPAGPSPSACTTSGVIPVEGLRIRYEAEGYGFTVANLNASGTVTLGLLVSY